MKFCTNWLRVGILAVSVSALCVVSASATAFGKGTVTNGPLRLREGPSTTSSIVATVETGSSVIALAAAESGWYHVSYQGAEGYMAADYLSVTAPVPDENNSTKQVNELNLRAGPDTSHEILTSAKKGEKVTLLAGPENGWYKVCYKSVVGYMSAEYLSGGSSPTATDGLGSGYVNVSALNLRSGPNTDSSRILVLRQGDTVALLSLSGGWYKISYKGTVGYVSAAYITPGEPAAQGSGPVAQAVALAKSYLGVRYVYGGSSPSGFDCSGFTQYIYRQLGHSLNRTASAQLQNGAAVSLGNLQSGDLVFFRAPDSSKPATHVGIYIGNGQFIHASSTGRKVMISDLSSGWYHSIFTCGRRIA
jgi:cell wall-associated NlpC family hydrolase